MEKSINNGNIATFYDVYFLGKYCYHQDSFVSFIVSGIVLVISGVLTYWNVGFTVGFWEYSLCNVFISIGYMFLVLCLAEMISILPFSGMFFLLFSHCP